MLASIALSGAPCSAQMIKESIPATSFKKDSFQLQFKATLSSSPDPVDPLFNITSNNDVQLNLLGADLSVTDAATSSSGTRRVSFYSKGMATSGPLATGTVTFDVTPSDGIPVIDLSGLSREDAQNAISEFYKNTPNIPTTKTFSKEVAASVSYEVISTSPNFVNSFSNVLFNSLRK